MRPVKKLVNPGARNVKKVDSRYISAYNLTVMEWAGTCAGGRSGSFQKRGTLRDRNDLFKKPKGKAKYDTIVK